MRVHIISDMEGVCGITRWEQAAGGAPMYEEARRLYTEEINAAVRGARAAGADEVVVMDHHGAGREWSFNSLVPELLEPECDFVVQQRWTEYSGFLEQGCDACLLVGMHARAGTLDGLMNHTISTQAWQNLWFNGALVGEIGINAAFCGAFGCPVLLVTGDTASCREGRELLGDGLTTVAVKEAFGRTSARHVAPRRARVLIEDAARECLRRLDAVPPYDPGRPAEIQAEFMQTAAFDEYRRRPGLDVVGDRTLVSRAPDWLAAWRQLFL
ncbi:MAG TPA: M55 family metallopeptidase [Candidatus Dormibacteraeota bacterium]|nr:M55 family metallopeptidase [Candidatus Dormibacteraeota bacterium]